MEMQLGRTRHLNLHVRGNYLIFITNFRDDDGGTGNGAIGFVDNDVRWLFRYKNIVVLHGRIKIPITVPNE